MVVFPLLDEAYRLVANGMVEADNSIHWEDNEIRTGGRSSHPLVVGIVKPQAPNRSKGGRAHGGGRRDAGQTIGFTITDPTGHPRIVEWFSFFWGHLQHGGPKKIRVPVNEKIRRYERSKGSYRKV